MLYIYTYIYIYNYIYIYIAIRNIYSMLTGPIYKIYDLSFVSLDVI